MVFLVDCNFLVYFVEKQLPSSLGIDDVKLLKENKANNHEMMAICEAVFAQSQKDNAPPQKSVFELMQKISKSHDVAKQIEIDV